VKTPTSLSAAIFIFADPKTRAQDMPETPPPIIKTSNIIIDCRSSFLQFFRHSKIKRIKTAQNEAPMPMDATMLSP
jgi:hypothetical protein